MTRVVLPRAQRYDFEFEYDPELLLDRPTGEPDQGHDVGGRNARLRYEEVGMARRDLGTAALCSLQAGGVNEPACGPRPADS